MIKFFGLEVLLAMEIHEKLPKKCWGICTILPGGRLKELQHQKSYKISMKWTLQAGSWRYLPYFNARFCYENVLRSIGVANMERCLNCFNTFGKISRRVTIGATWSITMYWKLNSSQNSDRSGCSTTEKSFSK